MSDLISRQAAIEALDQIFDRCEEIEAHLPEGDPDRTGYKMYPDYMTVWKYLHQLPSAKPDVVRCKDCKFYEIYELKKDHTDDKRYKPSVCVKGMYAVKRRDDWFCADAERRRDG